jgi:hypothetical protein
MELNTAPREKKTAGLGQGIAALDLGIASLICSFFGIAPVSGWMVGSIGLGCAIAGMILANKGIEKAIEGNTSHQMASVGRKLSIAGLVLSIVFIIIGIIITAAVFNTSRYY